MQIKISNLQVEIGKRIRFYRKKRNLTLVKLSKRIDISPQQLQKYEAGKNSITVLMLGDIATALDIPLSQFLNERKFERKENTLHENSDNEAGNLIYNYSKIRSEKLKKLLLHTSSIYAEQ
jgi:transcriptional regulator with XRE-family HTH domain